MEEEASVIHGGNKIISMTNTYCYNNKSISTSCTSKILLRFVEYKKQILNRRDANETRREQSENGFEKKFLPKKNVNFWHLNLTK